MRSEGHRDGVIAGAHRSDAARPRRIVEGERAEQRAPRLEGAGALEQLQLEEDVALRPERVRDRGGAPTVHRGLVDQIAEGLPGRLHRGKIGRGHILLDHPPLLPAEARRALLDERRHGLAVIGAAAEHAVCRGGPIEPGPEVAADTVAHQPFDGADGERRAVC